MKKLKEKLPTILVILALIGYFLIFCPLIVSPGKDGQPKCKSLIGITVGC